MPPYAPKHREYRDPSMREFWESRDAAIYVRARHDPIEIVFRLYKAIRELVGTGAGLTLLFLFACAMPLARIRRLRLAIGVLVLFLCWTTLYKYVYAHYLAPGLGAYFVVAMFGLRLLRCHRLSERRIGRALAAWIVALTCTLFLFDNAIIIYARNQSTSSTSAVDFRHQITARLASEPGTHLVLVRYNQSPHEEIVYNSPDIDAQKIVWAFDFGPETDRPLLDYYRDRKVWLIQPDGPRPSFEPYFGE
jgi:hypothetical protein